MQTLDRKAHWQNVYTTKSSDLVSWFQAEALPSLGAIARSGVGPDASLIDIGGGASVLVDSLLAQGWRQLTVLDVAQSALKVARARLGERAAAVDWIAADITAWSPSRTYDVWHDRAVFHFLTTPDDRAGYHRALNAGLRPGGHLILATFAADGPEKCSGLVVQRYDPDMLAAELGPVYDLVEAWRETHTTPWGSEQTFNWCRFVKLANE
jgi:2-polyprenyl-3-methyl-5-hydroxy-6-metoxy-1,4-benzoquinol methylase